MADVNPESGDLNRVTPTQRPREKLLPLLLFQQPQVAGQAAQTPLLQAAVAPMGRALLSSCRGGLLPLPAAGPPD